MTTERAELAETISRAALAETAAADAQPQPPPSANERYQLLGEIGRGGMGRVVEAIDRQFQRTVAIKELRADRASASLRERFAVEALVTGSLEHPAIVPVYERGERDGTPYYVMRRVRGKTLAEALAGASTPAERLQLIPALIRIAHAVGFAHSRGVIHRDLKPDNVIIDRHGEVFVLDWGIAKVRGLQLGAADDAGPLSRGSTQTVHGSVMGTPAYMAPEQARGELDQIDERTDVFALGAILYHLLTGRAPYQAKSADEAVTLAARGKHEPVDALAPALPAALRAVCARAMAHESAARFPTATELADALDGLTASALTAPARSLVSGFATVTTALAFLLAVGGAIVIWSGVPSFKELGMGAFPTVLIATFGATLGLMEWLTRGRHQLASLVLGFAVATFLNGLISTTVGLHRLFDGVAQLAADAEKYRAVMAEGFYEALGNLTVGSALAMSQLFIWAIARRATLRARAGAGTNTAVTTLRR